MHKKSILFFMVLSVLSLAVMFLAAGRESPTEWHSYQKSYMARLESFAKNPADKAKLVDMPLEVIQVVVVDRSRTDRCMTCHLATEDDRFSEDPQPLTSHPDIPSHPFTRFGCTICHGGFGQATTTQEAHTGLLRKEGMVTPSGEIKYEEEYLNPIWRGDLVNASCFACHFEKGRKVERILARGMSLFRGKGCMGCHKLGGQGGQVGPSLNFIGDKHRDPEMLLKHFKNPRETSPGSNMPSYKGLSQKRLESLVAFMLSLRHVPYELVSGIPVQEKHLKEIVRPPRVRQHWDPPRGLKLKKNPNTVSEKFLEEGRQLYLKFCSQCHGTDGAGQGSGSPNLEPRPANFTERHTGMDHPIEGTFWKISNGRGLMPGWRDTFEEREIWALAEYVSRFSSPQNHNGDKSSESEPHDQTDMHHGAEETE